MTFEDAYNEPENTEAKTLGMRAAVLRACGGQTLCLTVVPDVGGPRGQKCAVTKERWPFGKRWNRGSTLVVHVDCSERDPDTTGADENSVDTDTGSSAGPTSFRSCPCTFGGRR